MPTTAKPQKVECLHPASGRRMNIDKGSYERISKAIYHVLKSKGAVTFTQLQHGVEECLQQQKENFEGAVGWYTITVQKDMEARGIIDASTEKGKKWLRLKKS